MDNNRKAILRTLIYSAIFHYPLTQEELWHFAITPDNLDKTAFCEALDHTSAVHSSNGYYFLPGGDVFVERRLQYAEHAKKKKYIAQQVSSILRYLPSILFIGITGSLAMNNTHEADDIDLFVITKEHTLWVTRLFILFILQLLGKRRKKYATHVNDTICVNLLLERSHLQVPPAAQNVYVAHEIAQVQPLYDRDATYKTFLAANEWARAFLPNAFTCTQVQRDKGTASNIKQVSVLITMLNAVAKRLQLWYMTDRASSAIISDAVLAFYTGDMQKKVLKEYEEALKKYKISNS